MATFIWGMMAGGALVCVVFTISVVLILFYDNDSLPTPEAAESRSDGSVVGPTVA